MRANLATGVLSFSLVLLSTSYTPTTSGVTPQVVQEGDTGSGTLEGERVWVTLRALGTPESGATAERGSAGLGLRIGQSGTAYLLTGGFDDQGSPARALCIGAAGTGSLDAAAQQSSLHAWQTKFELLSARTEEIKLKVGWSHTVEAGGGKSEVLRQGSGVITLKENESHTLDFERRDGDPGDVCDRNLRVDLRAEVVEDPRWADSKMTYDLWLVDEAPDGQKVSRHSQLIGKQGERVDFDLPSLRWPIPGATFADGVGGEAVAKIAGGIRGRIRSDGSIELFLEAERRLGIARTAGSGSGWAIDNGNKRLRLQPGETLSLVLPQAAGTVTEGLNGAWNSVSGTRDMTSFGEHTPSTGTGMSIQKDSVSVDFGRYLSGHKMSILVTSRRAP